MAYAHLNKNQVEHAKMSDRAIKTIFVGYTDGIKAYRLYDPISKRIIHSRSVVFKERANLDDSMDPHLDVDRVATHSRDQLDIIDDQDITFSMEDGAPSVTSRTVDLLSQQTELQSIEEKDDDRENTEQHEPDMDIEPHENPEGTDLLQEHTHDTEFTVDPETPPPTCSLRSRSGIRPPTAFSPSDWRSSKSKTDWNTGKVVTQASLHGENLNINASDQQPVGAIPLSGGETEQVQTQPVTLLSKIEHLTKDDVDLQHALVSTHNLSAEPHTIAEAFASPEVQHWRAAADEEFRSLKKNNSWTLQDLPKGRTSISCKWIFKAET